MIHNDSCITVCVSKFWLMILKHKASKAQTGTHWNLKQLATTAKWQRIACKRADEQNMQRRSIERPYLCKLVSRQGGEEGGWGSIRKNSGKSVCQQSVSTVKHILWHSKLWEETTFWAVGGAGLSHGTHQLDLEIFYTALGVVVS